MQKVWIDGELISSQSNIMFDKTGGHDISLLKFDTFHGGKSDKFRPGQTQYVWYVPPFNLFVLNPLHHLRAARGPCPE